VTPSAHEYRRIRGSRFSLTDSPFPLDWRGQRDSTGSDANGDTINLEAVIGGVPISRLAVCEPPYPLDPKGSQNRGRLWFFRRRRGGE